MKKLVNLIQRVAITHIHTCAGGFVIVQDYLVFSCCFSLNPPGNPEMCARQSDSKQQQSLVWLPLAHHPTTQSHLPVGPMFFTFFFSEGKRCLTICPAGPLAPVSPFSPGGPCKTKSSHHNCTSVDCDNNGLERTPVPQIVEMSSNHLQGPVCWIWFHRMLEICHVTEQRI